MPLKKVAIVGTGAIGGYYGACLARAGFDVHFLVRSDFAALKERGMRIKTPAHEWVDPRPKIYRTSEEIGACDLVIVALKATANGALDQLVSPLLSESTAILTLENGLGSDELLAEKFGAQRVIGGLCFICVYRTQPGEIMCLHPGSLSLAEFGRPRGPRLMELEAAFVRAGVKTHAADDLLALRWKKLVWNVPFNGLSIAAGGISTDRILALPELESEVRALMLEVIEGAAVFNFKIPIDFMEQQISSTRTMGAYKPSSLVDYLAGREVEVEAIWGEPLRRAEARGAELPRLRMLYSLLKALTSLPPSSAR
ncbi:MAG TPA: 2-dehydropantoate 2-reductase [Opitutaceae bacterium]|nr:2-dehydropantoate 2-reductase [Opitutaceae bacterium]